MSRLIHVTFRTVQTAIRYRPIFWFFARASHLSRISWGSSAITFPQNQKLA
jgi:hypothetical protein